MTDPILRGAAVNDGGLGAVAGARPGPEAAFTADLRRRRTAAGLSQAGLANLVGYSREYVSRAERPSRGLASAELVRAIDDALHAAGALTAHHERVQSERLERRHRDPPGSDRAVDSAGLPREDPIGPGGQGTGVARTRIEASRAPSEDIGVEGPATTDADGTGCGLLPRGGGVVGGARTGGSLWQVLDPGDALAVIEAFTQSVVERYELEGPALLMSEVLAVRATCRDLWPRVGGELRSRVALAGARQAGLLAYMSVNLDRGADAQAFAMEASLLATAAGDRDMLAWVKGTQSFAAYYQGRYLDALRHARAGLRIATDGPQRIRLLSNGVARAAGKLGEDAVLERAVEEALDSAGAVGPAEALGPCIAFEPYSHARAVANAATAFLSAGRYGTVLELAAQLDDVVASSESDWSKALVRLDTAAALARDGAGDLDEAMKVGVRALAMSRTNPIASIGQRAGELATVLDRSRAGSHRMNALREALQEWREAAGSMAERA